VRPIGILVRGILAVGELGETALVIAILVIVLLISIIASCMYGVRGIVCVDCVRADL
jgi:hypothetical protein